MTACVSCGVRMEVARPSGCCSARCRAAKSRRAKLDQIAIALKAIDEARAAIVTALELDHEDTETE